MDPISLNVGPILHHIFAAFQKYHLSLTAKAQAAGIKNSVIKTAGSTLIKGAVAKSQAYSASMHSAQQNVLAYGHKAYVGLKTGVTATEKLVGSALPTRQAIEVGGHLLHSLKETSQRLFKPEPPPESVPKQINSVISDYAGATAVGESPMDMGGAGMAKNNAGSPTAGPQRADGQRSNGDMDMSAATRPSEAATTPTPRGASLSRV